MAEKTRVMVVDDHELFRKGVVMVINRMDNMEVVGEAVNGKVFLHMLNSNVPDVVFMDISMPELNGIDATKEAIVRYPKLKIIALSMFGEEEYLQKMINAGASGFLLKNSSIQEIENAIHLVMDGKNCYSNELLGYFTNKYISKNSDDASNVQLTRRELEVLDLVAKSMTNQEIADKLFVSKRTIDGHKANLIQKTGSKNVVDLLIYSLKSGLVKI
ncbi:MAG: response regulator transcription factor [Bacteroidales bacterium]|nr:response regulator transcription factor [Bacteroidales bacterium]